MYVELTTAGLQAALALRKRKFFAELPGKIHYWINHGTLNIVVLGPGGAGKSTLGSFLSGNLDPTDTSYVESFNTERFRLKSGVFGRVFVAPGQKRRRYSTWNNLFQKISTGTSTGVINVVPWGYQSLEEFDLSDHPLIKSGISKSRFMKEFLKTNRSDELDIISELVPHLEIAPKRTWMLTLVTKQDLWWQNRTKMTKHYQNGKYSKFIDKVSSARGKDRFSHEYLSVSLASKNLITKNGEVLVETAAGYDQSLRDAHQALLYKALADFTKDLSLN